MYALIFQLRGIYECMHFYTIMQLWYKNTLRQCFVHHVIQQQMECDKCIFFIFSKSLTYHPDVPQHVVPQELLHIFARDFRVNHIWHILKCRWHQNNKWIKVMVERGQALLWIYMKNLEHCYLNLILSHYNKPKLTFWGTNKMTFLMDKQDDLFEGQTRWPFWGTN